MPTKADNAAIIYYYLITIIMEKSTNSTIETKVVFGALTVDQVEVNSKNPKYFSAQLRQVIDVESLYPTARPNAGLNDGLFSVEDFGIQSEAYKNKQTRIAWIDVPVGTTKEQVEAILKGKPDAKIIRMVSNVPFISEAQQSVIDDPNRDLTKDQIASRQLLCYPAGHENEMEPVKTTAGKYSYAVNVFTVDPSKTDSDTRDADPANSYVPSGMISLEASVK